MKLDQQQMSALVGEFIGPWRHIFYRTDGRDPATGLDCEGYIRYLFRLQEIELDPNIYEARKDFELVQGRPQFMDVAVFRTDIAEKRHVGIMLDAATFTHCNESTNGAALDEIIRPEWNIKLLNINRHRAFLDADTIQR
jgi:hypothetical protein